MISLITLSIAALLISASAELAARGIVGPNAGAGIRIPSVMASRAAWQAGHRAARWWMHLAALCFAVMAISITVAPETMNVAVGIGVLAGLAAVTVAAVVAHRAAIRTTAVGARDAATTDSPA